MTSISKDVYIDELDDIVKEYNNKYHTSIKMNPANFKIIHILMLKNKLTIKILNLKLGIM